jgi:hypothetical protein
MFKCQSKGRFKISIDSLYFKMNVKITNFHFFLNQERIELLENFTALQLLLQFHLLCSLLQPEIRFHLVFVFTLFVFK